jgi:hypothetical protein
MVRRPAGEQTKAHVSAEAEATRSNAIREQLFARGYLAYDRADYREARVRFVTALKQGGPSPKAVLCWAICSRPSPLAGLGRKTKRPMKVFNT